MKTETASGQPASKEYNMRDPNRIDKFCAELAELWKNNCSDWRFGQLVTNVYGYHSNRDPFFSRRRGKHDVI